jgi:ATP-dependent Lon protease
MCLAMLSAMTGRPVFKHVAMTGEITLRGRVLPVGGVREKVLAAHRAGLKIVVLPERNLKDLIDMPKAVKTDLRIVPVKHMDEVLEVALSPEVTLEPPRPRRQPRGEEPQAEEE